MKAKILFIVVALFVLALFASAAMAGPRYDRGMGYGPGYGIPPVSNLTPEQQVQLTVYGYGSGYGKGRMGGHMGCW